MKRVFTKGPFAHYYGRSTDIRLRYRPDSPFDSAMTHVHIVIQQLVASWGAASSSAAAAPSPFVSFDFGILAVGQPQLLTDIAKTHSLQLESQLGKAAGVEFDHMLKHGLVLNRQELGEGGGSGKWSTLDLEDKLDLARLRYTSGLGYNWKHMRGTLEQRCGQDWIDRVFKGEINEPAVRDFVRKHLLPLKPAVTSEIDEWSVVSSDKHIDRGGVSLRPDAFVGNALARVLKAGFEPGNSNPKVNLQTALTDAREKTALLMPDYCHWDEDDQPAVFLAIKNALKASRCGSLRSQAIFKWAQRLWKEIPPIGCGQRSDTFNAVVKDKIKA